MLHENVNSLLSYNLQNYVFLIFFYYGQNGPHAHELIVFCENKQNEMHESLKETFFFHFATE